MMEKASKKVVDIDFEAAIAELNQLVEQMEHGDITLEAALQHFERGISLVRTCQKALQAAEQKVQLLLEQNGQTTLTNFPAKEPDA